MKKLLFALFLFWGVVVYSNTLQKEISYKLKDASKITTVSFEFINGKARVKGAKVNSIIVKGTITVRGKEQSICEDILKNAQLKVKSHGDELEISLNYEELKNKFDNNSGFLGFFCSWGKQSEVHVDLDVVLPERLNIDFSGVNFDLELSNIRNADLSNVNGNVYVVKANKVKCESVNGNITLRDIVFKADCEVVNGNLTFETKSSKISSISFESVNGNADIKLPASVIGTISTESLTSKTSLIVKGKRTVKKNLEWEGEGNCDIDVETINGRIVIEAF